MMPRPGVDFPDRRGAGRQRPPGDRATASPRCFTAVDMVVGARPARRRRMPAQLVDAMRAACGRSWRRIPAFTCGTRPCNLDAEAEIIRGCRTGRIDLLAFNDHMDADPRPSLDEAGSATAWSSAPACTGEAFDQLVQRIVAPRRPRYRHRSRRPVAAQAAVGMPMLSHDDETPAMRQGVPRAGRRASPSSPSTRRPRATQRPAGDVSSCSARPMWCAAAAHTGWTKAADMIAQGPLLGARLRLLLSGAVAGRASASPLMAYCRSPRPGT